MTEKDIEYVESVLAERINAPKYVKKQCEVYRKIIDDEDEKYCINYDKRVLITEITKLLIVPRGLSAGKTVFEILSGFQWLFIFAVLTAVYRDDTEKRRYETGILGLSSKVCKLFFEY